MKKLIISGLLSCSLLLSGLVGGINKTEASTTGEKVSDIGVQYLGVPYQWGGTSPSGFDCSGFLGYVFKQVGITLPRTAADIYTAGQSISKSSLQEGDLVFFTTYKAGASHAGIYIGGNQFVHSASKGVKVDSLSNSYWSSAYYGAKRVLASNKNGWVKTGSQWFYYVNGSAATGWEKISGSWYFLASNGAMQTGWIKSSGDWYFLDSSGKMKTGWVLTSGDWYYLYSDGSMAKNTTIQGYRLADDGAWIQ
jgi:hypothetical protein